MARMLIINGSPRAKGNSSFLAERAVRVAEAAGAICDRIDLARLKMSPCNGCDACKDGIAGYCVFKDDMCGVCDSILSCEALLFVAPIYWFACPAQLKTCIDRLYGLWMAKNDFLKGKKVGVVLVYGDVDPYKSGAVNAIGSFEQMFRFLEAELCGFAYGTANDLGDAEKNLELVASVEGLARTMLLG